MNTICIHCFVSGRVQGVFYRRATFEQAVARGLTGWVKNHADGRVEALLCGETEAVNAMQDWLWEGSSASKVTGVDAREVAWQELTDFEVR